MCIAVPHTMREEVIAGDRFYQRMRERGFSVAEVRPIYSDPLVLRQPWLQCPNGACYPDSSLYYFFGQPYFRRLLRAILAVGFCTTGQFHLICPDKQLLQESLTFLQDQELVHAQKGRWMRGKRCFAVHDIGHTFEWYIAEWFRRNEITDHLLPVRHGVTCNRGYERGDLDVVVLLDDYTLMIECKSTPSQQIERQTLARFVARAQLFPSAVMLLLLDQAHVSLPGVITRLNTLLAAIKPRFLLRPYAMPGCYWNGSHIYVASIPESVESTLTPFLHISSDYTLPEC